MQINFGSEVGGEMLSVTSKLSTLCPMVVRSVPDVNMSRTECLTLVFFTGCHKVS